MSNTLVREILCYFVPVITVKMKTVSKFIMADVKSLMSGVDVL